MTIATPFELPDEAPLIVAAYVLTEKSIIVMPGNIEDYLRQLWGADFPFEFKVERYDGYNIRQQVEAHYLTKLYKFLPLPWFANRAVKSVIERNKQTGADRRYALKIRGVSVFVETRDYPMNIDLTPDLGRRQLFPEWQTACQAHTSHVAIFAPPILPRAIGEESRFHIGVTAIIAAVASAIAYFAWLSSSANIEERRQSPIFWGSSGAIIQPDNLLSDVKKHILPQFLIIRPRWQEQVDRNAKYSPAAISQGLFLYIGHEVYFPALPYAPDDMMVLFSQIVSLLAAHPYAANQILETSLTMVDGQKLTFSAKTNLQPEMIGTRKLFRLEITVSQTVQSA